MNQTESVYSKTIEHLLEVIGNTTATFLPILGGKSIELTISSMEEYLRMLKELQTDYDKPSTHPSSPMFNDSMLVHRNRLSRTSKSRLTVFRAASPMEIDRHESSHCEAIVEESTMLDPTVLMDESTHQRGFLADVSDMNGTVRSRNPSFNFNYLSPVSLDKSRRSSILPLLQRNNNNTMSTTLDLDADVSSFVETSRSRIIRRAIAGGEDNEMRTP
uniref:BHLH domain-containing protein n=1 Tax=Caenorhabditis tropicalis TaxID=1561998 RepID=A0A1I7U6D7_9PELO